MIHLNKSNRQTWCGKSLRSVDHTTVQVMSIVGAAGYCTKCRELAAGGAVSKALAKAKRQG